MSSVLTFDIGTTYFKVCLFDDAAKLIATSRATVPVERPNAERAELSVIAFRRILTNAVHDLGRQTKGLRNVSRISFATQANSFTLLDAGSEPLLPFILWPDRRAQGICSTLADAATQPEYIGTTGVAELNHLFLPIKLCWLHQFEPQIMARARRLCCIGDYLVWWLTGNHLTEAGSFGMTGLIDIHRVQYLSEMLKRIELPIEWLPEILRAGQNAGKLRPELIEEWGVGEDCRLSMGCLDQFAGAIGAGNVIPGGVSETTGTVLATVRCTESLASPPKPEVFCGPSFAVGVYYEMVFSEMSAGILERYRNSLPDLPSFAELDQLAAQVPAGSGGLRLRPDAAHREVCDIFLNQSSAHNRAHEVRAILEAVAAELNRQVNLMCGERKPAVVLAAGGGAKSALWLQIKSEVLGCPVQAVECSEPTSLGAALLALGRVHVTA